MTVDTSIGVIPLLMRGLGSMVGYAVVIYGIYKIYTMSNEVSEIREILRDLRSRLDARDAVERAHASESTENLIRAVNTASYQVPEVENISESN